MHFFTTSFLAQAAAALEQSRSYHVAFKNIPSTADPIPGCKLEQFIFDVFPLAGQKVALLEVNGFQRRSGKSPLDRANVNRAII